LASSVVAVMVTMELVDPGAAPDPAAYQSYAVAFAMVVGLVFLAAGVARLGFITQFLSKPVMDGFVSGMALLFLLPAWSKKIPAGLLVLFGYIALSTALGLEAKL